MSEHPWEGHIPDQTARVLVTGSAFVICFGLANRFLKETLYLGEPLLATILGSILGPYAINLLNFVPLDWVEGEEETELTHGIILWIVRIVICIGVLFAAATCPQRYPIQKHNLISLIILMFPIMILAWLVSACFVKACVPSLGWDFAMVVGSTLAPTDPVLAGSIVKGVFAERYVPAHIRQLLSAESAINDGFGTPFVFLVLHFIKNNSDVGDTVVDVILRTILWNVILGTLFGIIMGYIMRHTVTFVRDRNLMDEEALVIFSFMMVFLMVGLGNMLTTNELLAACFAGFSLNWSDSLTSHELYSHFSEGVEVLNDTGIFFLIGILMPWSQFFDGALSYGNLVLLGFLVMLFRRLPGVLVLYKVIPNIENLMQALTVGHFGPIGVGAFFYALLAIEELPEDMEGRDKVIPTILFIVMTSVVTHGISAPIIILARKLLGYKDGPPKVETVDQRDNLSLAPSSSLHMDPYGNAIALQRTRTKEQAEVPLSMDPVSRHQSRRISIYEGGEPEPSNTLTGSMTRTASRPQSRRTSSRHNSLYRPETTADGYVMSPPFPVVNTHVSKRISSMGGYNQYARRDWEDGDGELPARSATIV